MNDFTNYHYFQAVGHTGSFSSAAHRFGQTPSAISRRISRLEDRIGKQLLIRSTRSLKLTPEGELYLAYCNNLIQQMEFADEQVRQYGSSLAGTLKIVTIAAYASRGLNSLLDKFSCQHPGLSIELISSESAGRQDLVKPDIEILSVDQTDNNFDQLVVAIEPSPWVICASPDYLHKYGKPESPIELSSHNCLLLSTEQHSAQTWQFSVNGKPERIKVTGRFSGFGEAIYSSVISGLGIGRLALFLVREDLESGKLVQLFKEHMPQSQRQICARPFEPDRVSHKARVFLQFLEKTGKQMIEQRFT